jgi:hypothetical protein
MDQDALLKLWKFDEMPACDEGMRLAEVFLESCSEGVNRFIVGVQIESWNPIVARSTGPHSAIDANRYLAAFAALVFHGQPCPISWIVYSHSFSFICVV